MVGSKQHHTLPNVPRPAAYGEPAQVRDLLARLSLPLAVTSTARSSSDVPAGDSPQDIQVEAWTGSTKGHLLGMVPALLPRQLGSPAFCRDHGVQYAYMSGAMAAGIASESIVEEMAGAGMVGIFGAAGLSPERVEQALVRLEQSCAGKPWGSNLIHSPSETRLEATVTDLYLRRKVRLVEASAFLDLTANIIRYRLAGIHQRGSEIITPNRVVAKVSRVEVATKFMSPPPAKLVAHLVSIGELTEEQGRLAAFIPMAQDVTAEADSGGHTDNRPLVALLPSLIALRDRLQAQYRFPEPVRVGAAGGIATPQSTAAAYVMGAAYVVAGSVHQACLESGTSDVVRQLLAEAQQADCIMAPAADMFEMGVKLQVLRRGTMFAMRASKLYELYRTYPSIEAIPETDRQQIEKTMFHVPLEQVWRQTVEFFTHRDPRQLERAEKDPKHKMALIFRWYLGQSSRWANQGLPERRLDYQIWCGPSMGAFNEWTSGTFLAQPAERKVATVAMNLLYGAAYVQRANSLQWTGFPAHPDWQRVVPQERQTILDLLQ
jgi:PfaD family protein